MRPVKKQSLPAPASAKDAAEVTFTRKRGPATVRLHRFAAEALWPMVDAAFRNVDDHVEARFFQVADLQIVISRAPAAREAVRGVPRRLTLEVWPSAGPRVLQVEWSGRRPYIVHRRDGEWLDRLIEASSGLG